MKKGSALATVLFTCLSTLPACGPQLQRPGVSPALVAREREQQKELALKLYMKRYEQLMRVANTLQMDAVALCGDRVEPLIGALWLERQSFPEDMRDAATRVFGLTDELQVRYVVPRSPADSGGLQPGDEMISIDGTRLASAGGWSGRSKLGQVTELVRAHGTKPLNPLKMAIRRDGRNFTALLIPRPACRMPLALVQSSDVNAFADGERIGVTTGMLRFVEDDHELALVLSHELAHNVLGHVDKQRGNQLLGTVLGLLLDAGAAAGGINTGGTFTRFGAGAGVLAYSQAFEMEADYLGLYFAAKAGFDIAKAPDLFRRMGMEHPGSIKENFLASHPSTPERAAAIEAVVREIKEKAQSGRPLVPEKKPTTPPQKPADDRPSPAAGE